MAMFDSALNSLWAGMQAGLKNRPTPGAPSAEPRRLLETQMKWVEGLRDDLKAVQGRQDLDAVLSDINTFAPRLFESGVAALPPDLRPDNIQASFGINPETGARVGAGGATPSAAVTPSGGQPAGTQRAGGDPGPASGDLDEPGDGGRFAGMSGAEIETAKAAPVWRRLGYGSKKAYLEGLKQEKLILQNEAEVLTGQQTGGMFVESLEEMSGDAPIQAVIADPTAFSTAIANHQVLLQSLGFDQESIDSRVDRWWKVHDKMMDGMDAQQAIQSARAERQDELFQDLVLLTSKVLGITGGEVENFDDLRAGNVESLLSTGHKDFSRVLISAADLAKQDGMTLAGAYQSLAEKYAGKLDSWPISEMTEEEKRKAPETWPEKWQGAFNEGYLPKKGFKYAMRNGRIIQYVVAKPDDGSGAPPQIVEELSRYLSDWDLEVYKTADAQGVTLERAEEIVAEKRKRQVYGSKGRRKGSRGQQRQAGVAGSPDPEAPELQRARQAFGRAVEGHFGITDQPRLQTMVGRRGNALGPSPSIGDTLFGDRYGSGPSNVIAPLRPRRNR